MCHIDKQIGVRLVRNLPQARKINDSRISGCAGEDHARFALHRKTFHFIIINRFGFRGNTVGNDIEQLAGEVHRMSVGQMPAVVKTHGKNRVSGIEQGEVNRHVRLASGVRLDIRGLRAEKFAGALDRDLFHFIDELASAVVAPSRISFRILIRQDGTLCCADRGAGEVLGRNQLDAVILAFRLLVDPCGNFGVRGTDGCDIVIALAFKFLKTVDMSPVIGERSGDPCQNNSLIASKSR